MEHGTDAAPSRRRQRRELSILGLRRRGVRARRLSVETEAGRAQYVVAGSGPPVVMLHGLDGSSRWWSPTIRALAPHYRCYALEFVTFDRWRERGRVPLPRSGAFVAAWLEALGLDWAHAVAHSMGAYAALSLALERPQRVGRLVLIAPAVLSLRQVSLQALRETGRMLPFLGSIAPGFLPVLVTDSLRTGPARWLRSAHELRHAPAPRLDAVRAPTLLIWGTRDPLVPPSNGPLLQSQIPGSRLLKVRGARHVPMYERPRECGDAILRFLRGREVGEP